MSLAVAQKNLMKRYVVSPFFNFYTVIALCILALGYAYCLSLWLSNPRGISNLYLLAMIQLTPFVIAFSRQHYNYLAFVLFNHCIAYTVSKYNQLAHLYKATALFPETLAAIQETLICTVIISAVYYLSRHLLFFRFIHKERFQMLNLTRGQLLVVAGYVISVPLFVWKLPTMLLALHFAAMAADMVLLLCSDSPGHERLARYMRWGVFLSTFWYFIATGFLSLIGNLATYLFITGCLRRDFRTLLLPVILGVAASAIQSVKQPYRVMLRDDPDKPVFEKIAFLQDLLNENYFNDIGEAADEFAERTDGMPEEEKDGILQGFARLGDDSLERVLAWTPSRVPFWGGQTYAAIPFIFIPRIMWPDKPSRRIWNKFGQVYGYLSSDDVETSVGVGFLAEGYMNFGFAGLYGVAALVGLIIAFVERVSYYFLGGYFYFTYICFLMPLMQPSTDLSSMITSIGVITTVLFLFRTQFVKMARKDEYS